MTAMRKGERKLETMFETERLAVRKFRADDAKRLYENHKGEKVKQWMSYVSKISDYDRYEVVAVDQYKSPLFER